MPNASGPMACPVDGATLVMSERSGIEIDYCPQCRGVWLDRGELDKIIERSAAEFAPAAKSEPQPQPQHPGYQQQPFSAENHGFGHGYGHKKRKKSFFEEIFD